ncbi:hypothetical protein [Streptomyces sp. 184]|uniref:hypothetical protein n=1 Tax=Streptomyces sp. 184 TaxID=1827526 RepID=UPI0038914C73
MFEGMTVVSGVVVLVGAVSGVASSLHEAGGPAAGAAEVVRWGGSGDAEAESAGVANSAFVAAASAR